MKEDAHEYFSLEFNDAITGAVFHRLRLWGGRGKSNAKWLPASKVRILQEIVRDFVETYNLEEDLLNQLLGWECALGQMVDTDDADIVAVLPYILTAYIYNFGEPPTVRDKNGSDKKGNTRRNRYVYAYLQQIVGSSRKRFDNDYFFGVESQAVPKKEQVGIGALLNGTFPNEDGRQRLKLKNLSKNFVFPETALVRAGPGIFYLVPTDSYKEFEKRLDRAKIAIPNHNIGLQDYIVWDGGRELFAHSFWNVFLSWCYVLLQRKKQGCQVAEKVDFLLSTWLMCCAMHDEESAQLLKSKTEEGGETVAQEWIVGELIELYTDIHKKAFSDNLLHEQEKQDDGLLNYGPGIVLNEGMEDS